MGKKVHSFKLLIYQPVIVHACVIEVIVWEISVVSS